MFYGVLLLDECAIYGWMCHFWMNVLFMDESAIFRSMWKNVLLLDECAIPLFISMTSLLMHTLAHSTWPFFKLKTNKNMILEAHFLLLTFFENFNFWSTLFSKMTSMFGWMCHLWMNVPFMDQCAIFGSMCYLWMNLLLLDEYSTFGWKCHFWMNVPFMDEYAIFGWTCYLWMNLLL
jgi:hypothetical protein